VGWLDGVKNFPKTYKLLKLVNMSGLRYGFVGAGMMGSAMIRGLISAGMCTASEIIAADIDPSRLAALRSELEGLKIASTNVEVGSAEVVVLAVEPRDVEKVCHELSTSSAIFVSLAAGVTLATLEGWLPAGIRIARVMPNTPCTVGEMAAGYVTNDACAPADISRVGGMLGSLGSALRMAEEDLLDAVTGVSGSGPAYVFQFIEALSDGGVRMGLNRQHATELAAKTVRGAATMVLQTGKHPGALKDEVRHAHVFKAHAT
jgi:pyrroline-5-carboxylate reductase